MLKLTNLIRQSCTKTSPVQSVRSYFKPSQKEVFYDVEGVVTKDILLFRFDDTGNVLTRSMVALLMLPVGAYLGYSAYQFKTAVEPVQEAVAENPKLNWKVNQVISASTFVGIAYFLFGAGLSSYWAVRTLYTVRRLILRKGGKHVSLQTYSLSGKPGKIITVPTVHCSGAHGNLDKTDRFLLKIRDHSFNYQLNLKDGVINQQLNIMTTTKEEADDAMKAKKELIEQRMKDRQNERETERNPRSETNTEDLVKEFFNDFDPEVDLVLKAMKTIETSAEKDMHQIDNLVKKIQILQESVSDASIFLPAYDSKKCQQTLNDLNNKYQDLLEKVKPKKKFGFKNRKQKPKVPDISSLTVSGSEDQADNVQKYSLDNKNHYDIKDRSDENIVLDRNQVQGKDVTVTGLTGCRLEIHGAPLTLHLTNISECTILSGPVSSSVMVDTCSASSLAISCQQLRTHSTTDTDIYLHTTAKAILEDCRGIRVAPYNWEYPGADQDYSVAGLDRNINNWQQIGDFNWLSSDVPSPNWAILEEEARKQSWN